MMAHSTPNRAYMRAGIIGHLLIATTGLLILILGASAPWNAPLTTKAHMAADRCIPEFAGHRWMLSSLQRGDALAERRPPQPHMAFA